MPLDPVAYLPYKDPDDFIREVTDLIWVDRSIHYIRENYEPDSIVHGGLGTSSNRDEVIEGSLMRISATPDRTGQAEDVIWEARGDDAFLSSHLVLSGHLQTSEFSRTIANCLYRRGRMVEEWVVRDTLAGPLARGEDLDEVASAQTFRGFSGSWNDPAPADPIAKGDSGERPDEYRAEVEKVIDLIKTVWNDRDLQKVEKFFERDLVLLTVGNRLVIRPEGYRRALLRFLESTPPVSSRSATSRPTTTCGTRVSAWPSCGSSSATTTASRTTDRSRASRSTCWASRSSPSTTAPS